MEKFIVSARKYRPSTFESVVGQDVVTSTLKSAIANDQLAQAFLFCGPRGVGKTTCARILAKTINCENITDSYEPCNTCESCKNFADAASLNVYELDAASNNSVEGIKRLVEQVRIPPQSGNFKVYIIDEVHMLSNAAFNAFLKTLEEPPAYAKFILATTEKHKILPTILSRCQIFEFRRIEVADIARHLAFVADKEGVAYEKDALNLIAQKADGALRDALSIFDQIVNATNKDLSYKKVTQNLNVLDYDFFFKMIDHMLKKDIPALLLLINEILSKGFDGQHVILGLGEHMRNLLISKDESTLKLLDCSAEVKETFKKQAAAFNTVLLVRSLDLIGKADQGYRQSQSKRLFLELNILQIAALHFPESESEKKKLRLPPAIRLMLESRKEQAQPAEEAANVVAPPAPTPQASVARTVQHTRSVMNRGVKRSGTLSIRNYHKVQHMAAEEAVDTLGPKRTTPFGQQELNVSWNKFILRNKNEARSFVSGIANSNPKIMDNYQIAYEVQNDLIQNDTQNTSRLLSFLKDDLKNDILSLKPVRSEGVDAKFLYTDQDKYKKLVADYPILARLKEVLDLELEF